MTGNKPWRGMEKYLRQRAWWTLVLVLFLTSCDTLKTDGLETAKIRVDDVQVTAELAIRPEDRRQGLMYRGQLPPDHGMLFIFEKSEIQSFWMKNTIIPLDVGFFDAQGFLIDVYTMEVDDGARTYTSTEPAKYALEMNAGWFRKNNLRRFSRLHLPSKLKQY